VVSEAFFKLSFIYSHISRLLKFLLQGWGIARARRNHC